MARALLVILAFVAACFDPHYDHPACTRDGDCPGDLHCGGGICYSPDEIDAALDGSEVDALDASAPADGAPPVDAPAPIDASAPVDAPAPIDAEFDSFCTSPGLQACFRMDQPSGAPIDGHLPPIAIARADATTFVVGCHGTALDLGAGVFFRTGAPASPITNLTAEAWVKLNTVPSIADGRRYWFDAENSWGLSYAIDVGGNVVVRCLVVLGAGNFPAATATLPNPTQWNHVACTWDSSRLRLFINGNRTELNPSDDPIVGGDVGFQIGRNAVDSDGATQGQIDDVRVWNRRVSDAEIQATASAGCQ